MALTNKEKMARRQAKIAADPQRREKYLKAERDRNQKRRKNLKSTMTNEEFKKFKEKESARILKIYNVKRAKQSKFPIQDKPNCSSEELSLPK